MRLAHYKELFARVREKPGSLSATEAFSIDVIYLLHEPTVGEFAEFIGISQPNASYKVNCLAAKGYLEKTSEGEDRRETRLRVTEKFRRYYGDGLPEEDAVRGIVSREFDDKERRTIRRFLQRVEETILGYGGKCVGSV